MCNLFSEDFFLVINKEPVSLFDADFNRISSDWTKSRYWQEILTLELKFLHRDLICLFPKIVFLPSRSFVLAPPQEIYALGEVILFLSYMLICSITSLDFHEALVCVDRNDIAAPDIIERVLV